MADETRKQYVKVTGEGLKIQGWKETTLIIGTITMQVCFIVANVQSPQLGLPDINDSRVTVHTGDTIPTLRSLATLSSYIRLEHIYTLLQWFYLGSTHPMRYSWTRQSLQDIVLHR
eukprot:3420061-Amphidinium_carterae.3